MTSRHLLMAFAIAALVGPLEAALISVNGSRPRIGMVDNFGYHIARKDIDATMYLLNIEPKYVIGTATEVRELARVGKIDLAFTPSDLFGCMAAEYNIAPVATIVRRFNGVDVSDSAGVIFTRHELKNIKTIEDIKGKTVAAMGFDSLFGFQAQRYEMYRAGMILFDEVPEVIFTGNFFQVVWEVLNGTADVGFVQSGIIEEMVEAGLIHTPDIRFINEYNHRLRNGVPYPFRCSTDLYGDWVLSAITHLSENDIQGPVASLFQFNNSFYKKANAATLSYWRPPLAYMNTIDLLEDLSLLQTVDGVKNCASMNSDSTDIVCPFGFKQAKDMSCSAAKGYSCPYRPGYNYTCVCRPCIRACGELETYSIDGSCTCSNGAIKVIGVCQPLGVLAAIILGPVIVFVAVLILYLVHRQHLKADGIWQINPSELILEQPPEVLGAGSYGVVLAAKLRGQMVAVKRAYVNKSNKYRHASRTNTTNASTSSGFHFGGHNQSRARDRSARLRMRNFFIEAEAAAAEFSSHGHSAARSTHATRAAKPWWVRIFGPSAETRARRQLFREMRLLSRMQHDNICRMLGAVVESGMEPLMVLECMEMGSLYNMLHNEAMDLDDDFRYNALHDIISGMRYLHNSDLVHGDLKALNCLVDGKFHVKVSDFGMAAFSDEHSQQGGTLAWMAPELLQGGSTSFASDVYSFGIVMFEVFARADPYDDVEYDSETLVQNILRRKLRPAAPPNMPNEYAVLMNEALSTDSETRPTFIELLRRTEPLEGKMKANSRKTHATLQDDALLEQVFPKHIAAALREGRTVEPEHHAEVTIFFSDICGFTDMSATLEPVQVSNMLNRLYTVFDALCDKHGLYKIETIGDAYMCVGNLFTTQLDHAARVARFAMDAMEAANAIPILEDEPDGDHIDIRVGFHSGPVVSNVVGTLTPRFCLFGSTVNCASRMESNSVRNCIHISPEAAALVQKQDASLKVIKRNPIVTIKGLGKMQTFWLNQAPDTMEAEAAAKNKRRSHVSAFSVASMASRVSSVQYLKEADDSKIDSVSVILDNVSSKNRRRSSATSARAKPRASVGSRNLVRFEDVTIDIDGSKEAPESKVLPEVNELGETSMI